MSEDSRSARSAATRSKIIKVAERLFAERGIEGVSLNDINKAAGQRNKNATHYHFGNKEGLLQAILDKHEPGIQSAREAMLDELEAGGDYELREVVRALVQPIVDKLLDPDGGREFMCFSAQLVVAHTLHAMNKSTSGLSFGSVARLARMLYGKATQAPEPLDIQRGILIGVILTQGLAEHARLLGNRPREEFVRLTRIFSANLVDAISALLMAPVSADTLALIEKAPA